MIAEAVKFILYYMYYVTMLFYGICNRYCSHRIVF